MSTVFTANCPWDLHVADVGQGLSLPQGLSQFNCLTVEQIIPTFWHVEPTFNPPVKHHMIPQS